MIVLGLTGSIGMGKSTLAAQFERLGAKVCNADLVVHALLSKGGAAVEAVEKEFPGIINNGEVDRKALGAIVFADDKKRALLEHIIHPLVVEEENRFLAQQEQMGAAIAVLDIPLLFETGAEERCDAVVVATAPYFIQRQRVLARAGMTPERFARIVSMQMSDSEKRARADFVVQTGLGKAYSMRQLKHILRQLHA